MAALNEPIISGGIRHTNYFQGRVLSAEDLATDQTADRRHRAQLGRAIGSGIVSGLEVGIVSTGPAPTLSVEKGLSVTPDGGTIELPSRVALPLLAEIGGSSSEGGVFGPCGNAGPGVDLSGGGAYLLVLSPGQDYRERAPKVDLDSDGIAGSCGARYLVKGATLRLVALPLAGRSDISAEFTAIAALDDPASTAGPQEVLRTVSRFRNRLAHLCLADAAASGQAAALRAGAPAVFDAGPTLLEELTAGETPALRGCDVPLAALYLDLFGLRFVDNWTARRLARPRIAQTTFSLFPADGLERLLQFAEQLDDILGTAGTLSAVRIGDYFRFVPPAAWFPASGSGVAGFSPSQFLAPYTRGVVGRMTAGQAAERLDTSLRHRAVDLAAGPCLLSYDLDENETALVAGAAGRRVRLYTARAINGPLARDALALALEGAWDVVRGLHRRLDEVTLQIQSAATRRAFDAAQEAVAQSANRYAAVALARALDDVDTLRTMTTMLELQRELADALAEIRFVGATNIPGSNLFAVFANSPGSQLVAVLTNIFIANFVTGLRVRLNGTLPGSGAPGLAPAIAAGDVCATIAAQEAVNAHLAGFTGETGSSGPAELSLIGSSEGQTVVPGGPAFPHIYEISNGTDRRLTFQLEASAEATNGDWSGATSITDTTNVPITAMAVDSGATGRFVVSVAAPADAVIGETAELSVRAVSPPPNFRDLTVDPLPLLVGDSAGHPVDQTIRIPEPADPQLQQIFTPGQVRALSFTLLYQAETGPAAETFDVAVVFDDPVAGWLVSVDSALGTPEGPPGRFVQRIQLTSGVRRVVAVNLRAPTAGGPPVNVRLVVTSTTLDPEISVASPPDGQRFTLAVATT
jgi:hypothetical protein